MILSIVMATLVGMLWACVGMLWAYEKRFEVIKKYGICFEIVSRETGGRHCAMRETYRNGFEICRPTL